MRLDKTGTDYQPLNLTEVTHAKELRDFHAVMHKAGIRCVTYKLQAHADAPFAAAWNADLSRFKSVPMRGRALEQLIARVVAYRDASS